MKQVLPRRKLSLSFFLYFSPQFFGDGECVCVCVGGGRGGGCLRSQWDDDTPRMTLVERQEMCQ